MSYDALRKRRILAVNPNSPGHEDPRIKALRGRIPVKLVGNTKSDPELARLYSHGPLKWENTGDVCGNCMNYYPDPNLGSKVGRCKARGYMQVHEETPAKERKKGWTDPRSGMSFQPWPECPLYVERVRSSPR
ncbi:MAG TPA: hypothetical protein VJR06_01230 [Nitrososphaerales archaeon]|nr:hypothetical protein [Nitrososphaerales archaeon]